MKVRESGMPDRKYWESFFDPELILGRLELDSTCEDVVEFGCGHGTFTIPAAQRVRGTVTALDLDPAMLESTGNLAQLQGVSNIRLELRDFVGDGTGLPDGAADYAMVFNILHLEDPIALLREAHRCLAPGGRLGIIHWIYDAGTPRGPPLEVRPQPEQCRDWAAKAGFTLVGNIIELPPYHYGMQLQRT